MKKKEIKQLSKEEIKNRVTELRKELMKLNAQRNSGTPPENPGNIKKTKKTIARILTFANQTKTEGGTKTKNNE